MNYKIKKKSFDCFLLALIISISEIFNNGNYNLLYIFGIIFFIKIVLKKVKKDFFTLCLFSIYIIITAIIISLFSPLFSSYSKTFLYCFKLMIAFAVFLFFKNSKLNYEDIRLTVKYFIYIQIVLTLSALIFYGNSLLWINNDIINGFTNIRLKLFFIEPSYLAFYLSVAILVEIYDFCFGTKEKSNIIRIVLSFIMIILAFSISGIIYSCFAIIMVLTKLFVISIRNNKVSKYFVFSLICVVALFFILISNNNISGRMERVINGTDASTSYRVKKTMDSLPIILKKSYYFGFGYGNMNTNYGLEILNNLGVAQNYSNAFPYFIAETGIFGIIFLLYFHGFIIKNLKNNYGNRYILLKKMMVYFLIFTSIAGNWFTNPGLWMLYGLTIAKGGNYSENNSN